MGRLTPEDVRPALTELVPSFLSFGIFSCPSYSG
jgi:hypothetical protein